jgi:hypothetical protein
MTNLDMLRKIRDWYTIYKPYVFSDGWYYVFIVIFILLLFVFFS